MITYDFKEFPYTDKPIYLPENTVFFRGISSGRTIEKLDIFRKDMPIYLASESTATAYASGKDDYLIKCYCTKKLRLLDIRKMIRILPIILNTNLINANEIFDCNVLKLVFGICDLPEQLSLLTNFVTNIPVERVDNFKSIAPRLFNLGFRVPITNLDSLMFLKMKSIFGNYYDGIISPRLYTPFEVHQPEQKSHEEIILFDASNLAIINSSVNIELKPIVSILMNESEAKRFAGMNVITGGTKIHKSDRKRFHERNKYFENPRWLKKHQKQQTMEPIVQNLWNNSYWILEPHLRYANVSNIGSQIYF